MLVSWYYIVMYMVTYVLRSPPLFSGYHKRKGIALQRMTLHAEIAVISFGEENICFIMIYCP